MTFPSGSRCAQRAGVFTPPPNARPGKRRTGRRAWFDIRNNPASWNRAGWRRNATGPPALFPGRHHGTWSIALQEGLHQIEVTYTDYRAGTQEEFNRAVQEPVIWDGVLPDLEISGPNFVRQPIAAAMLLRDR